MNKNGNYRAKDVRARIIEESIRLFSDQGFKGTSIQTIADAVGIREPSLLYHFGSKKKLRDEVVNELLVYWKEELPRLLSGATGRDRFSDVITEVIRFFLYDVNRARLVLREMLDRPQEIGAIINTQLGPWIKLIAAFIRNGQKSGEIHRNIVPEAYISQAIMIVASAVALRGVTTAIVGAEPKDTVAEFDELARILRDILFVKPE